MTMREHRMKKRIWREGNKRRMKKNTLEEVLLNTSGPSPIPEIPRMTPPATLSPSELSTRSSRGRKQARRNRTTLHRYNIKFQEKIDQLEKKIRKYKKRLHRKSKKDSSTNKDESNSQNTKKYSILSNAIKERYKTVKSRQGKRLIQSILQTRIVKMSRMQLELVRDTLGVDRPLKFKSVLPKRSDLVRKIHQIFLRDDVTRATAGKKETVTHKKKKVQKRFLLDSMKNLCKAFLKENSGLKCHYSYFTKYRPFYVKPPTVDGRDTCLCKLHANVTYVVNTLHKNKVIVQKDTNEVLHSLVCSVDSVSCMKGVCPECKNRCIDYDKSNQTQIVDLRQWIRKSEVVEKAGKKVKITKNVPVTEKLTIKEVIYKFESELQNFKTHIHNIRHQYKAYRQCIDGLTESEVALHIDFSENYACKYHSEVQSHHFGGSRNQITLHTAVMYHFSAEAQSKRITSYCTVSSNQNHGPSAIWAHLHPILSELKEKHPAVTTVHFFSDGPATQYKQKINFYLMANRFFEDYGFRQISWNFFESGHGKGAADGVGGIMKRQADAIVARGSDIADVFQFFSALKYANKIKLFMVTDADVKNVAATIPSNIVPLKGTMQVHQMYSETRGILNHRVLSCFCEKFCSCHDPKTYQPLPEIQQQQNTVHEFLSNEKEDDIIHDVEDFTLSDITNTIRMPTDQTVVCGTSYQTLQPEDVHPMNIKDGVHVLVKVRSNRKIEYTYAGVAKSTVDEEGDVMFEEPLSVFEK
ncbi:unnamed protein product [Pieris macdunnoughi]|uniref:Uncharacterized protein n=1 Tax=Pieris macdunnoughi TaxID=345717 RepID=A0A821XN64_9NEOP|nr:unnamed protein product [Pieris macdunnoughi]